MPHPVRNKMIAKIKIGQQQLGMADDAYRAMLVRVAGKDSCGKMGVSELERVLAEMARLGFGAQHTPRPNCRTSADPMMRKIEALLLDNGWPWNYAHATAKRMFGVDRVQWLSDGHMHKLVAALQIAANRKHKRSEK